MRQSGKSLFAVNGARLDAIDLALLRLLNVDGRTANTDLADSVNLSPSAALQRVRRLESSGAIKRYLAEVDDSLFQDWSLLLIRIVLSPEGVEHRDAFEANVAAAREIVEAIELAGAPDYLLMGALPSASHWPRLRDALDPTRRLIERAKVASVVRTLKPRGPHPLLFAV